MELGPNGSSNRPFPRYRYLRPAAVWLGLASFFVGSLFLGATLAPPEESAEPLAGPVLLSVGVGLVGGAFTTDATDVALDPDVEFEGVGRYFAAGISVVFLSLSIAVLVFTAA
jgi:hypothetical protein